MKFTSKLMVCASLAAACTLSSWALDYNDGRVTWKYFPVAGATGEVRLGDGTNACVSASTAGEITLPDTIGGAHVTTLSANAFKGCAQITGISIQGNLCEVEEGAFDGASALTRIGVLNRNDNFFSYKGVLYIGDWYDAELVRVPEGFEAETFRGLCAPQVWWVWPDAFKNCSKIQKIAVNGYSADSIDEYCSFEGCSSFTDFVWEEWCGDYEEDWYESRVKDGVLYTEGFWDLVKWPTAKPLDAFENLQRPAYFDEMSVRAGAFAGNAMSRISLPDRVYVDGYAFMNCRNLKQVTVQGWPELHGDMLYASLDEESGFTLEKVICPGFPKYCAEEWDYEVAWFKENYPNAKIVFEKVADPNVGQSNITIPYTLCDGLFEYYDFAAYVKDLTTLTFEGAFTYELYDILDVCPNVRKIVYSANPLYRDYGWNNADVYWDQSWKEAIADWPDCWGRTIEFVEGAIPEETQVYRDDYYYLHGIYVGYDEGQDKDLYLSPFWPTPSGVLEIPEGVEEIGEGAFDGLTEVTKLVLPSTLGWLEVEASGVAGMTKLETIESKRSQKDCWEYGWGFYTSDDGVLHICDGWSDSIVCVPPAWRGTTLWIDGETTGLYGRNIRTLRSYDADNFLYADLSHLTSLTAFGLNATYGGTDTEGKDYYGRRIIDGAIYEGTCDDLCLLLWPNAKRPIKFDPGTRWVDCEAFRNVVNPQDITEFEIPANCDFDLWSLADYGFTGITKLTFKGCPSIDASPLEFFPNLREIAYSQNPRYAEDWEWVREDFAGTGVTFMALPVPTEPELVYELDVWDEDDWGNVLYGECSLGYGDEFPFAWPALTGKYVIPEQIDGFYVVAALENAFVGMSGLREIVFPSRFGYLDAGMYTPGNYDWSEAEQDYVWVPSGEPPVKYSPFVGCTSLTKLTFKNGCPQGLWEALELTPSIREVAYYNVPWHGESGWTWPEFIAEFSAAYPDRGIVFTALPPPGELIWNIQEGAYLYCDEVEKDGEWVSVPAVWPSVSGTLTVPNGIREIGESALAGLTGVTEVVFPESIEWIDSPFIEGCSPAKLVFKGRCYPPSGLWELLEATPSITTVVCPSKHDLVVADVCGDGWERYEEWRWLVTDYRAEHPESNIVFMFGSNEGSEDPEMYIGWEVVDDTLYVWCDELPENPFAGFDMSGVKKLKLETGWEYWFEEGVFAPLVNLETVELDIHGYGEFCGEGLCDAFAEGQLLDVVVRPAYDWDCECDSCGYDEDCVICSKPDDDCDETCGCPGTWELCGDFLRGYGFVECNWIRRVIVEEETRGITDEMFWGCTNLREVVLPASLEWMGGWVFAGCENLRAVYFNGDAPYGCLNLFEDTPTDLVSYVKFGTRGWNGIDGDAEMPSPAVWPVWEDNDPNTRTVSYAMASVVYTLNDSVWRRDSIEVGKPFNLPFVDTVGYTFSGWKDEDGKLVDMNGEYTVSEFGQGLSFFGSNNANTYSVTFNANGGNGTMAAQSVAYDRTVTLSANAFVRPTFAFVGWALTPDGNAVYADGAQVRNLASEQGAVVALYAIWERVGLWEGGEETVVVDPATGANITIPTVSADDAFTGTAAATYNGFVVDADGRVLGSVLVKAAKANAKSGISKLTATLQMLGAKKLTFKGELAVGADYAVLSAKGAPSLFLSLGSHGLSGRYGAYMVVGAANLFMSKDASDKALAQALLAKSIGTYNLFAKTQSGDALLSFTVGNKGAVKTAGTVGGVKVSAKAQLLLGDGVCCIPVLLDKKVNLAFNLWIDLNSKEISVDGLGDDVICAKVGTLQGNAAFKMDSAAILTVIPGAAEFVDYLPNGLSISQSAGKWIVAGGAKAGKVQLDRKTGAIDEAKLGKNPSALKLTYKAKDGSFKGSFKAYSLEKGKIKAYTVNVEGVMVGNTGYGSATLKKPAVSIPVTIE
ncbi:MAG: leucine-rich repeat protein [Kiritimatiellae bacterium]|nr:leucine-rich repeat protein [Kiritimatiellia bacterium]